MVALPPLTLLTYVLLATSVIGLWVSRAVWIPALAVAIVMGYVAGVLSGFAAIWMVLLVGALGAARENNRGVHISGVVVLAVLALALGLHVLPGFHNPKLADQLLLSPAATPYTLYLNFDKTLAGIAIVVACSLARLRSAHELKLAIARAWPWMLLTIIVLISLSVLSGYARFDPKWTAVFLVWAPVNLLFTCLSEEAFFRGLLQARLQTAFSAIAHGRWLALGIGAMLFGIAHLGGGSGYVAMATLAGVGYGYVYQRSGIEMSMLTHFAVNATHFLFFTYPRAA